MPDADRPAIVGVIHWYVVPLKPKYCKPAGAVCGSVMRYAVVGVAVISMYMLPEPMHRLAEVVVFDITEASIAVAAEMLSNVPPGAAELRMLFATITLIVYTILLIRGEFVASLAQSIGPHIIIILVAGGSAGFSAVAYIYVFNVYCIKNEDKHSRQGIYTEYRNENNHWHVVRCRYHKYNRKCAKHNVYYHIDDGDR